MLGEVGGCSEVELSQTGEGMYCGLSGVSLRRLRMGKSWMVLGKKGLCWEGSGQCWRTSQPNPESLEMVLYQAGISVE